MSQFNFRLQKVLDIRKIEVDKAQQQLYKAKTKEKEIKRELDNAYKKINELFEYIRNNNLSISENIRTRNYIKKQKELISNINQKYLKQKKIVNKQKNDLLNKKQNEEKIIKLKEKAFNSFYNDLLKTEQNELDEISMRLSNQGV